MAQLARTFRIFVSSTFNDLKAERNALQEIVYPRLKELCERNGARFQAIDLRWGVSEEAANDQQTINICLTEVDRCRDTSPRPNFIVLLGDRYGWRPPPPQIEAAEFDAIRDHVSAGQRARLDGWYLRDDNAVPPEYRLKEREGDYENFDNWDPVERELTDALRRGAAAAGLAPAELTKYVASATEQEIARGALRVDDAPEHVFCFFRSITNLEELKADIPPEPVERPTPEAPLAEDFVDLRHPETDRTVDSDARDRLDALKDRLRGALPGNVHDYEARWTDGDISKEHIEALCRNVLERLSGVIEAELRAIEDESPLDREIAAHERFGEERARFFVPRFFTTGGDALATIARYVGGTDNAPLAVAGVSGSGKSALVAKAAEEAEQTGAALVRRFIGATPESSDGRALLASLCQEISWRYGPEQPAPADYRELVEELPRRLALATAERPLIVFLDALDQLSDAEGARSLVWLPAELPPNVRVVVSALRADPASEAPAPKGSECYTTLQAKLPDQSVVELKPMSRSEGEKLLNLWLADAHRDLRDPDGHQRHEVLSKFAAEEEEEDPEGSEPRGLPLYLKLAFEEARRWHSDTDPEEARLAPGIPGIIRDSLFKRLSLEENHGEVMVSHSLGYLGAAKNGISEDELLGVLSAQEKVLEDFKRRAP